MNKNDEKIKLMMEKVAVMKKDLGNKPRAVLKTNGLLDFEGRKANLNVMSEYELLVVFGNIISSEEWMSKAAKRLGISGYSYKFCGFPLSDWEADFKVRIAGIEYGLRKAKLDATEAQLKALMSEDARTGAALEDLEKTLR